MRPLSRALDEDGPVPFAFWLGRLCEEFHCLPSDAYREWLTAPAGLLEEILEMRAFARAKEIVDAAKTAQDIPRGRIFDLVKQIAFETAREDLDRRQAEAASHVQD